VKVTALRVDSECSKSQWQFWEWRWQPWKLMTALKVKIMLRKWLFVLFLDNGNRLTTRMIIKLFAQWCAHWSDKEDKVVV
jgi:hypothetical protein